jgi:isopentenyl-diphosphate delta-isomerase
MTLQEFPVSDVREQVIRVDESDGPIGPAGKIDVHLTGTLHRAFSVFLFDASGRTLLQKRADGKYHSGGLWTNSCCGHPRPGEPVGSAAERRVGEELRLDVSLKHAFCARYRAELDNGLIENEFVHVFFGRCCDTPTPNAAEASAVSWSTLEELTCKISKQPQHFSKWLIHYVITHGAEIRNHHWKLISQTSEPRRPA